MPSKTPKQRRLMEACSTDKGRARMKADCPPKKVAQEFRKTDRAKAKAARRR